MPTSGSVTHWVGLLKAGDSAAAQPLWERYFHQLVTLARKRLQGTPRRAADEEDVALSAFDSFCRGAELGRFPQLNDRNDLWQLLVMLAARKAVNLIEHERRQKRGGGKVLDEAVLQGTDSAASEPALAQVIGDEPTPEFAAQVAEECERLLNLLGSEELRSIALWKMEGATIAEIAARLGCAPRTVDRKLERIRVIWEKGGTQ
jgi:DNA-directed RNA polymerase specialized sigma24 family protein